MAARQTMRHGAGWVTPATASSAYSEVTVGADPTTPPECAGCAAGWPLFRDRWNHPHRLIHVDPQNHLRWAWHGEPTIMEIVFASDAAPGRSA